MRREIAVRNPAVSVLRWLGMDMLFGIPAVGARIEAGEVVGRYNSMDGKMYVSIISPATGVVTYSGQQGMPVEPGRLILRMSTSGKISAQEALAAEVFQEIDAKCKAQLKEAILHLEYERTNCLVGSILTALVGGILVLALLKQGGIFFACGLLLLAAIPWIIKEIWRQAKVAQERVEAYPGAPKISEAFCSAISVHAFEESANTAAQPDGYATG